MSKIYRRMSLSVALSLPTFAHKIKHIDGKAAIWDVIRRKFIVLTPEEWVRQHVVHLLLGQYHYPKKLFRVESGLRYNNLQKRTDILVFDRTAAPFLLVECKAPNVPINANVLAQAVRYNASLLARYILITNGLSHFVFDQSGNPMPNIPAFED